MQTKRDQETLVLSVELQGWSKNIIRPKLSLKVGYISCIEIYAFIEAVIWWGIILIFLGS